MKAEIPVLWRASMKVNTHFCLTSAQPTPNLTPALDPTTCPRRVILLTSQDMKRRADWLEAVLKQRGIAVERWSIDDPWDIEHVQQRVLELLEEKGTEGIALNATGGTKPMSIAAYEVFRAYDLPIFYVHPEQDRLVWLHPAQRPATDLENRVKLDVFLQAHGVRVVGELIRSAQHKQLLSFCEELILDIDLYADPLRELNYHASRAEGSLRSKVENSDGSSTLSRLIDKFAQLGLVTFESGCLRFLNEDARFFVNGGWLELHAFRLVQSLRQRGAPIHDLCRSMVVARESRGQAVKNELDIIFLAENRLHLIECKTRHWGNVKNIQGGGPGAEALYKLDTLRDLLGGLQARAMLVSYQHLPKPDRRRAEDLGIRVCAGAQIQHLRERIFEWLR